MPSKRHLFSDCGANRGPAFQSGIYRLVRPPVMKWAEACKSRPRPYGRPRWRSGSRHFRQRHRIEHATRSLQRSLQSGIQSSHPSARATTRRHSSRTRKKNAIRSPVISTCCAVSPSIRLSRKTACCCTNRRDGRRREDPGRNAKTCMPGCRP